MPNDANLPVFTLAAGPWKAEVFDPRPDPFALGTRYCHGSYVRALWRDGRILTDRARPNWIPADGEGLPEEFEMPIGFASALDGEEYIRIGAGRLRRKGRGAEDPQRASTPVRWDVLRHDDRSVVMHCSDRIEQDKTVYAYDLIRTVRLSDDGLDSASELRMQVPWNHPMEWFAHPFFAHTGADRTGFELPGRPTIIGPMAPDASGLWRLPPYESLAAAVDIWGTVAPVILHLDPKLGGGKLSVQVDRPLDHLVLYCSPRVASPETKIMRAWRDGEQTSWTIRYRWAC